MFIINNTFDESYDGKTKDIMFTIDFLKSKNIYNLIDNNNYIRINIVRTKRTCCFGVEDIFKRMYKIFKKKIYLLKIN